MKKYLAGIIMFVSFAFAEDTAVMKVVYNLTTGDLRNFEQRILSATAKNKAHYESRFAELKVAVIIHGKSYKFFIKDLTKSIYKKEKSLMEKSDALHKRITFANEHYGIEFLVCEVGMNKRGIQKSDLLKFVKITPNAVIGLIDKQNDGYAYIPVK